MTTKLSFFVLFVSIIFLSGCKTSQLSEIQTGTFKVTIFYPNREDATFDMDYYQRSHMPMVAGFLGKNLKFYEIDKGLSGRTAGEKATFVAVGYFFIHNVEVYNKAIADNREAILNDFKNYTNIQPVLQISEVKQVVIPK